jgi:hypothetical protein
MRIEEKSLMTLTPLLFGSTLHVLLEPLALLPQPLHLGLQFLRRFLLLRRRRRRRRRGGSRLLALDPSVEGSLVAFALHLLLGNELKSN